MKPADAIAICEEWFAYLARQRQKAIEVQRLAVLARTKPEEAQQELRRLDRSVTVYDGARLEPAVKELVRQARKAMRASTVKASLTNE